MIPKADAAFVYAMENVLDVYERPYDARFPVINLDESPKQLIGQERTPFFASDGTKHEDYEYVRNGTVSLFMINEALRGYRKVMVRDDHKAVTYAEVITHIVEDLYPQAQKITIVEDNLSAHKLAALYDIHEPERAHAIARKIEVVRTPKHGSWLNIAECELSVLTKHGLKERIPTKVELIGQVTAWYEQRNQIQKGVDWRFTTPEARIKLKRLYPQIQT